jgi:spermidine synthase
MSDSDAKLFVLHGYSPEGDTWLSFREPNETQIAVLCKSLVEDRYDKPFLVENRKTRSLCFGIDGAVQSEMWLDDPETLVSAYTRKMMGFLLFRRRPREVLMIGLGGGSLAKFCHRHLPSARMTVIEIDTGVIALRSHFQIPPDDSRLRVINGDGSAYVAAMAQSNQRTDVLLVDAFDRQGIATAVTAALARRHRGGKPVPPNMTESAAVSTPACTHDRVGAAETASRSEEFPQRENKGPKSLAPQHDLLNRRLRG